MEAPVTAATRISHFASSVIHNDKTYGQLNFFSFIRCAFARYRNTEDTKCITNNLYLILKATDGMTAAWSGTRNAYQRNGRRKWSTRCARNNSLQILFIYCWKKRKTHADSVFFACWFYAQLFSFFLRPWNMQSTFCGAIRLAAAMRYGSMRQQQHMKNRRTAMVFMCCDDLDLPGKIKRNTLHGNAAIRLLSFFFARSQFGLSCVNPGRWFRFISSL